MEIEIGLTCITETNGQGTVENAFHPQGEKESLPD